MRNTPFSLKEFEKITQKHWQSQVASDVAKTGGSHSLVHNTPEGLKLMPIYGPENKRTEWEMQNPPGFYPYTRGFNCLNDNEMKIQHIFESEMMNDLSLNLRKFELQGVKQVVFNFDLGSPINDGLISKEFLRELSSIDIDLEYAFEFGDHYYPMAAKVEAKEMRGANLISYRVDPLGNLIRYAKSTFSWKEQKAFLRGLFSHDFSSRVSKVFTFKGEAISEIGGSHVLEMAYLITNAVSWIKELRDIGADKVIPSMQFSLSVGNDFFQTQAKFRAFRFVWARVMKAFGLEAYASSITIEGFFPRHLMSQYDSYNNMLRNTQACFAAGLAGSDYFRVFSFDEKLRRNFEGFEKDRFWSDRLAINTYHLLSKESKAFQVMDPAGGSFYIENLTAQLAQSTFNLFKDFVKHKSFFQFVKEGGLTGYITESKKLKVNRIREREIAVAGVNQYSNLEENITLNFKNKTSEESHYTPDHQHDNKFYVDFVNQLREGIWDFNQLISLFKNEAQLGQVLNIINGHASHESIHRYEKIKTIELFENLRMIVEKEKQAGKNFPGLNIIVHGDMAKLNARIGFCQNYFEVLGLKTQTYSASDDLSSLKGQVCILVSIDTDYDDMFELEAIKKLNPLQGYIAGNKFHQENYINIYAGQDVYGELVELLKKLEVEVE